MDLRAEVKRITEERLLPHQFLVDVHISAKHGPKKVLVIVDSDTGLNIDDCAELSRSVAKDLDDRNVIDTNYTLEVTSPGVDQPLALKRQYVKNIGRSLRIKTGEKNLEGKLTSVADDKVVIVQEIGSGKKKETKEIEIAFSEIEKAFVIVSFK